MHLDIFKQLCKISALLKTEAVMTCFLHISLMSRRDGSVRKYELNCTIRNIKITKNWRKRKSVYTPFEVKRTKGKI